MCSHYGDSVNLNHHATYLTAVCTCNSTLGLIGHDGSKPPDSITTLEQASGRNGYQKHTPTCLGIIKPARATATATAQVKMMRAYIPVYVFAHFKFRL